MDTNQWPQAIGLVKPIHESSSAKPAAAAVGGVVERKPRPQKEQALNCPRCNSTNTKFCYYNNYSLTQPRYFCKTCRRYWTEGGTLRNVPVGGGSRKNKRSSISSSSPSPSQPLPSSVLKKLPDLSHLAGFSQPSSQNPKIHDGQDLNLAYPPTGNHNTSNSFSGLIHLPYNSDHHHDPNNSSSSSPGSIIINSPAWELLKSGSANGISPKSLSSLMSMPISVSNSGFYSSLLPMQDYKPKHNFCLDGFDDQNGYGISSNHTTARLFLPYEDLKPVSMSGGADQYDDQHQPPQPQQQQQQQNRGQGGESNSNGYWSGMLGGGSW